MNIHIVCDVTTKLGSEGAVKRDMFVELLTEVPKIGIIAGLTCSPDLTCRGIIR